MNIFSGLIGVPPPPPHKFSNGPSLTLIFIIELPVWETGYKYGTRDLTDI